MRKNGATADPRNAVRGGCILKSNKSVIPVLVLFLILFICAVAGPDPLFRLNGAYAQGSNISDEQLLARAINGEARGEPYEGQVAVGAVILNRVKDPNFPNTIAGVIYQPGAFTAVSDGQINVPIDPGSTVVKAARDALNGWDPTDGCIYYWNPSTATSSWIWSRKIVAKIGKHNFGI
jgi:N-acetylmuramoyl-L-alanine amidase